MLRKSIQNSAAEPSFFYLMMAESCFQRAVSTRHPKAGGTLREIGRKYLAKAGSVPRRRCMELGRRWVELLRNPSLLGSIGFGAVR
jgi:hypothetical protein